MLLTGLIDLSPDALDVDLDLEFELVEVDLVDPDMLQGEDKTAEPIEIPPAPTLPPLPAQPDPEADKKKQEEEEADKKKKEEEEAEEGPKRDLGKKRSKVDQLGPPNSTYHVLLSTRNIRKLKYRELAMATIEALPDYKFIVKGGGFNPWKDFDHILLASPDLRTVDQTFIAVDYKISREAVKAKVEKAVAANKQTIEWIEENGYLRGNPKPTNPKRFDDPRWFVLPEKDKVAFYVRKEFLPAVMREEAGEGKSTANFITKLTKLKRYARRIPTAGVQFEAHDLHAALKKTRGRQFELPDDLEATVEARADPELNIYLTFKTVLAAKEFEKWFKKDLGEAIDGSLTLKITVGSVYDQVEFTREGKNVTIWTELTRGQTETILKTVAKSVKDFQAQARKRRREERRKQATRSGGKKAPEGSD